MLLDLNQKRKSTAVTHAAIALAGIHAVTTGDTQNAAECGEVKAKPKQSCLSLVVRAVPAPHLRNSCRESEKRLHWQPASVETHHVATFDSIHTCLYDRCQIKVTGSARGGKEQTGTFRTSAQEACRCVEGGFREDSTCRAKAADSYHPTV